MYLQRYLDSKMSVGGIFFNIFYYISGQSTNTLLKVSSHVVEKLLIVNRIF